MAVKVGEAFVELTTKNDKYNKGLSTANTKLKSFGTQATQATGSASSGFLTMGKAVAAVGLTAFAAAMGKVFQVTAQQEAAEAQLNAVLKSTKGVAGLTAKELKNLASSIQETSVYGDELIIRSEALLLTFTQIGNEVFPRAQQAIVDMASAMGTDLQSATIQVGKALNDPILGVSALRRVGVQLTEDQESLVKQLVETGDVAKAQGIILGELETQFGGAAKAAADTLGGSLAQLKNTFGDLLESTGFGFADTLKEAFQGLNEALKDSKPLFEAIGTILGALFDLFTTAIGVLWEFAKAIAEVVGPALRELWEALQTATDAVVNFIDELRGIEEVHVNIAVLADETPAEQAAQKRRKQISEDWLKARDEARNFAKSMVNALETPAQAIQRQQEENLEKLENFRRSRLLTEQQYADAKVAINEQAEQQITELQRQQFEERVSMSQGFMSATTEILGVISELFNVDTQNRLQETEAKKQKRLDELNTTFETEKNNILSTVKNKKRAEKLITKLEETKAKKEAEIQEKSDREKARIEKKAFERQRAFRIVETVMATGQAIVSALAGPWPASIAFAVLAGVMGAAQLAVIASQKAPAMADGGIAVGETLATIGEAGQEAVFPLEGTRGRKTRQMFADNLISAIGSQQERGEVERGGTLAEDEQIVYNIQLNIGGEELFTTIQQGIDNRNILIDERSLTRR